MRAYSINPETQEVAQLDLAVQANTVYTFFNSISTDEINILDKHTIYTDADAISQSKKPFFIGEQLIVGKALVLGKDEFLDVEATIPLDDLKSLINYDISAFYEKTLKLLSETDINLYRFFSIKDKKLDSSWVLHVFSIADDKTQNYFLKELQTTVETKEDISTYMKTMAGLALQAMG